MVKFLKRVGVSDTALKFVHEIVQTCPVCREWSKPGPAHGGSIDLPDHFNQKVDIDLVFIHKHIILSTLDRCTRWHAAVDVDDKEETALMVAVAMAWAATHGPPEGYHRGR